MIRSINLSPSNPIEMEEVILTPAELAKVNERWQRYDRNAAWLQAHAHDVYSQNRGKYICIAGQELFVADSVQEVLKLANQAHPEDDGRYLRYVPRENTPHETLCLTGKPRRNIAIRRHRNRHPRSFLRPQIG
jgi:hypothetical protein